MAGVVTPTRNRLAIAVGRAAATRHGRTFKEGYPYVSPLGHRRPFPPNKIPLPASLPNITLLFFFLWPAEPRVLFEAGRAHLEV